MRMFEIFFLLFFSSVCNSYKGVIVGAEGAVQ